MESIKVPKEVYESLKREVAELTEDNNKLWQVKRELNDDLHKALERVHDLED